MRPIKQVSEPAIQQATQQTSQETSHQTGKPVKQSASQPSNKQAGQPVNPGGRQADLKGGLGGLPKDQMTAAATTSQQLWTSGGALVQRAQEPNIPFGESLTSTIGLFEAVRKEGSEKGAGEAFRHRLPKGSKQISNLHPCYYLA